MSTAYRIVDQARAWWPVTFSGVTEDGAVIENRIELRFAIMDQDAFADWMIHARQLQSGALDQEGQMFSQMAAAELMKIASDWRGVAAENGDPLKWDEANVQRLMKVPNVFREALAAFVRCREGRKDIREGN